MYNIASIANRTTLGGQASCLPLTGVGTPCSISKFQISNFGRRGQKQSAFTLIELLVVISIIALLISLLLPALSRAKGLALRIQGASNMRQIGIAMQEYANEYRGQYPLANLANFPFGDQILFGVSGTYPLAGLPLLYYDSFGVQGSGSGAYMVNPRPGILTPNVQGISMLFCPDGDSALGMTQANEIPSVWYNSQGLLTNWWLYDGLCYWVDRDVESYSNAYNAPTLPPFYGDSNFVPSGTMNSGALAAMTFFNADYEHEPAINPQSPPGSILVTDSALFEDKLGTMGLTNLMGKGEADSNYVDQGPGNFLPAGSNELYNGGSVTWVPESQIHPHMLLAGVYFGW